MDKYLSVITNFGCHYTCPYCVVKKTGMSVPKTTISGLKNLITCAKDVSANIISVSGGGDPLFEYEDHLDWWNRLEFLCLTNGYNLEIHTSYIRNLYPAFENLERMVYHCRSFKDIANVSRKGKEKVRVVFVVTPDFNTMHILNIKSACDENPNIDELSFRQLVREDYSIDHTCEDFLKSGHKVDWYYIEQGDYNTYYAENKVFTKFKEIKN